MNAVNRPLPQPLYVTWVAYNEERTLPDSFRSVERAVAHAQQRFPLAPRGIICHNGCTDQTPEIAVRLAREASFPVEVISSRKGMVIAQNACIDRIMEQEPRAMVTMVDADCVMNDDVLSIFLEQYAKHPELMAVGAHPLPAPVGERSALERLKHKLFSFRAYHPRAQVSKVYSPMHHPFADSDPQPCGAEFEKRSKTYFHGRCFSLRDASVWDVPVDAIGEDTYLDCSIHTRFGPGSIRVMYDANVFFHPLDSFRNYFRTYARIHKDKEELRVNPAFARQLEFSATQLDRDYLGELSFSDRCAFVLYDLLERTSQGMFEQGFMTGKSIDDLWCYSAKKGVGA